MMKTQMRHIYIWNEINDLKFFESQIFNQFVLEAHTPICAEKGITFYEQFAERGSKKGTKKIFIIDKIDEIYISDKKAFA